MTSPSPVMRAPEVAELLDVSTDTVYALVHEGVIPVLKLGRAFRFSRAWIESWIASGGNAQVSEPAAGPPA